MMEAPASRLVGLARMYGVELEVGRAGWLVALLDRMALEPQNLTAVDLLADGVGRHLADSLAGLAAGELREARSIVDIGSGGGFPGLALAAASAERAVTLVESERRKAEWLTRAAIDLPNVRVVADRAETLATHARDQWDAATCRAVGGLPVVVELAAPLLRVGGTLVAWTGRRDPDEEARAEAACRLLGLEPGPVTAIGDAPGRHLSRFHKVAPTDARFPRRPGRAAKRPLA